MHNVQHYSFYHTNWTDGQPDNHNQLYRSMLLIQINTNNNDTDDYDDDYDDDNNKAASGDENYDNDDSNRLVRITRRKKEVATGRYQPTFTEWQYKHSQGLKKCS